MSRRNNTKHRCNRCRMHASLCVCSFLPRIETRTRLALVIHRVEARKPTNTGLLATECLVNHEVHVRGHVDDPSEAIAFGSDRQPVLLFPHEDAGRLEDYVGSRPITLVVPDGTWRQASKVRNRIPSMRDVPCVSFGIGAPSRYRLRSEAHEHGLATVEAIARAFGILEGKEVEEALLRPFMVMVERTLWSRGELNASRVTGGVPIEAMRHGPSGIHA